MEYLVDRDDDKVSSSFSPEHHNSRYTHIQPKFNKLAEWLAAALRGGRNYNKKDQHREFIDIRMGLAIEYNKAGVCCLDDDICAIVSNAKCRILNVVNVHLVLVFCL